MMAVAGCAIGILTGCGVKKEVHEAMIADLNAQMATAAEAAQANIDELQDQLKSADNKITKMELDNKEYAETITQLKKDISGLKTSLEDEKNSIAQLESSLSSAKSATARANQQAEEAENDRATMEMEKQEVQRRFDMLRKNILDLNKKKPSDIGIELVGIMGDMSDMSGTTEEVVQPSEAPKSVQGILDDMGTF
jgi:chromosome segregation ATPase